MNILKRRFTTAIALVLGIILASGFNVLAQKKGPPAGLPGATVAMFAIGGGITNNGAPNPVLCHSLKGSGGGSCIPGDPTNMAYIGSVVPMPRNGRFLSLTINTYHNGLDGEGTVKLLINGIETPLSIQVPAGSTSLQTVEADVPFEVGDFVVLITDGSAASDGSASFTTAIVYQAE